ncbi:acyl-CoA dehydrogenase family protein [Ramlibacter sp.]|uniref:acyl-CoA dehydrogenase family protein n=1 Tax=Ramlibacter sp. TaxID=1917967 RepID=UPI003D0BE007
MPTLIEPLFPGMALDAAERFAQDHAGSRGFGDADPVAEMGWALTLVPEELGGLGGTLADVAATIEGLATHGVQLPVIETSAVAPLLLQANAESAAQWLPQLCDGNARFGVLAALSMPLRDVAVQARQLDIGWELAGSVRGADVTLSPTHRVLAARVQGSGEIALFVLDADRLQPAATYRTMEGRLAADFALDALSVPASACIARGAAASAALARADQAALLLTAIDTVASLAALLRATIAHLQERKQFGVALATFQALRHRVADMFVRYQAAKGLAIHAFGEYDAGSASLDRTLRLMKVSHAESARASAEAAIQMHGGMGVSEEVLATRLAQRLIASEFRYGDRLTHSSRLLREDAATRAKQSAVAQDTHTRSAR